MSKEPDHHLPIGFRVKHYEIRAVLGFGGFGITYKAWDTVLERTVAVKEFMPRDLATRFDDQVSLKPRADKVEDYNFALDRFLQEARTLAKFNHPNIVRVTDFVEANGTAYLVMDYVHGLSLSAYLRVHKGRVSEQQLRDWFLPLLKGLAEVHEAGFLHRDIKPGNIYIRDRGEPILIDFGAARQAIGEHTRSVTGIFTQGYAPVEQYATDSKMQGAWTDLYSIGATLYRCISRVTPVDSPTRQATIMDEEPDPLVPAVHVARGQYSEPFLELIDKLLVIQAKRRPRSTEAVIAELENCAVASSPGPPVHEQLEAMSEAETAVVPQASSIDQSDAETEVVAQNADAVPTQVQADTPTELADDLEPESISFTAVRTAPLERGSSARRAAARKAAVARQGSTAVQGDGDGSRGRGLQFFLLALLLSAGAGGYWFVLGPGSKGSLAKPFDMPFATPADPAPHGQGSVTGDLAKPVPAEKIPEAIAAGPPQGQSSAQASPAAEQPAQAPEMAAAATVAATTAAAVVENAEIAESADVVESAQSAEVVESAKRAEKAPDQWTKEDFLSGASQVTITSTPPRATVALNGIEIGRTPFTSEEVRAGDYDLTLSHADARSHKQAISITADQALQVDVTLDTATGGIAVISKPAGATIELNGKRLEQKTPATLQDIAVGTHLVVVSKDRFRSSTRKAEVKTGAVAKQEHRLEAIPYSAMNLDLSPRGAQVMLPDAGIEYTPGMELPAGTHRVLVTAQGYLPKETEVKLTPGLPIPAIRLRKEIPAGRFMQDDLREGGKGPQMVVLATGSFRMGCLAKQGCAGDEIPARTVELQQPIAMGRYEVTFEDYDRFAAATGAKKPDDEGWGRARQPVINVSWQDAVAYARWLSEQSGQKYRLPTEAEWEYAVRAGSSSTFYFGEDSSDLCRHANVADLEAQKVQADWEVAQCNDGVYRTAAVGSYRRNDFKLHDMHGNVWEWVRDCYYPNYDSAPNDGTARIDCDSENRVLRGGSWSDKPAFQRSTERDKGAENTRGNFLGFRLVRELDS